MRERERIVITAIARTPLDSQKGQEFREMSIPELAVIPVKSVLARSGLGESDVDGLIMGQMSQGTGEAGNLARHVALKAGLDVTTALGYTVNRICGSGFQAVACAMMELWANEGDVYIAAGCEMDSHRLVSLPLNFSWVGIPRGGALLGGSEYDGDLCYPSERFGKKWVADDGTAVPLYGPAFTVEKAAKIYGVTREEADRFAYDSQMKMKRAQDENRFEDEIVPIAYPSTDKRGKTESVRCDRDLHPKPFTTPEGLQKLSPAFVPGGVVTAGNASGAVDGAAAIVLMKEDEARRRNLHPIAYLNAFAFGGVDPTVMGTGPVPAIQKLFDKTGVGFDDVDVFEINEAFCAQVVCCMKMFGFGFESDFYRKLNPNGGATAIGHPEGCTGVRLTMTVAEELRRTGKRYGVASACIGGGQGAAILVENAD
ncbi:MAG: thiolase family protein [Clostridiales Family XIII bacterium]|jgi:acetyl-CoA acetyltransferase family protein|nr:thiolase family protein [Clostridiales Family XIII bacterium]